MDILLGIFFGILFLIASFILLHTNKNFGEVGLYGFAIAGGVASFLVGGLVAAIIYGMISLAIYVYIA